MYVNVIHHKKFMKKFSQLSLKYIYIYIYFQILWQVLFCHKYIPYVQKNSIFVGLNFFIDKIKSKVSQIHILKFKMWCPYIKKINYRKIMFMTIIFGGFNVISLECNV
jgi:hypothetical protein